MLVDVTWKTVDDFLPLQNKHLTVESIEETLAHDHVSTGIYHCASLNPNFWILDKIESRDSVEMWKPAREMEDFKDRFKLCEEHQFDYGVCDNHEQILAHVPEIISSPNKYLILMTPIFREHQSSQGGWRWHKWGPYLGDYCPQHEYLYDEEIDMVFVYGIYRLMEG